VWLLLVPFLASPLSQSTDEALTYISRNVQNFRDSIPDIICSETITSTKFENGMATERKVVESIFTARQGRNSKERFVESREVTSVDGKPVSKGKAVPKLPLSFRGGFSSVLIMSFAVENLKYHNYKIASTQNAGDMPTLLIEFETKVNQTGLRQSWDGKLFMQRDVGKALVDAEFMQVIRLERQYLNIPRDLASSSTTIDYARTDIGGTAFWMPKIVRVEATQKNELSGVYEAEYTNCRRFGVSVQINPLEP
jgi:hypothetical protein